MFIGGAALVMFVVVRMMVASVSSSSTSTDWADCPAVCQCKWISGKKTALCREAGFSSLPTELNTEMQVLDIAGNAIPYLPKEAFKSVGLVNLQRIFMKSSGVHEIHKDAFKELTILVEVDLSDNFVAVLHQDTFTGNERLKALYLSGNPISELKYAQFPYLPHLKTLEFQNCQIKSIHRDAFLHLPTLELLSLNGNKLNRISETVFLPVPKLKTLSLDGNPWNCNCLLRSFRNWLLQSKLYSHSLICTYPKMWAGKQWEDVDPDEFACPPKTNLSETIIQGEVGGNVTFKCSIRGDPEPNVTWFFNGFKLDDSSRDNLLLSEDEYASNREDGKTSSLILFNISETDAGDYMCRAENLRGVASTNVSLNIPKEAVATTMKKTESWFVYTAFVTGSVATVIFALLTTCICHIRKRSLKKSRRKGKLKGASSGGTLSEQDKKLLDASITTTDRQMGSCDGFGSQQDMEMMEHSVQSIPLELRDQPVHITIESHSADPSIAVFPPPPEFSTSILPHGAYGNIFISVSVGQEPPMPSPQGQEPRRYPDLLDVGNKKKNNGTIAEQPVSYFATLPRRAIQHRLNESESMTPRTRPKYDNMGPRITADGSSIISLPETISMEEIPTPPPPPSCSPPMNIDYISL